MSDDTPTERLVAWLREHQATHTDWADWFEKHPDDPRCTPDLGDAAFHRQVEARYDEMIAVVRAAQADADATIAALRGDVQRLQAAWDSAHLQALENGQKCHAAEAERDEAQADRVSWQGVAESRGERIAELEALINNPHVDEFFEAVRIEQAHQRQRWGDDHDASKRVNDWAAVVVYLAGKMVKSSWEGDDFKVHHHMVTIAAVMCTAMAHTADDQGGGDGR